jgi:hypothetical protein
MWNVLETTRYDNVTLSLLLLSARPNEANAREIATCKQHVEQKEDFMHSNFQMDISLPWIDAAFT